MKPRWPLLAALLLPAVADAQQATGCPQPDEVGQSHLLGLWRARFDGPVPAATLLLEPHAEYAQGVSGALNRDGERTRVAGDVDEGQFTLEESSDGVRISATWLGEVVPGSCGREIRGTWQPEGGGAAHPFVLRKNP